MLDRLVELDSDGLSVFCRYFVAMAGTTAIRFRLILRPSRQDPSRPTKMSIVSAMVSVGSRAVDRDFQSLQAEFDGELRCDPVARKIYSTDASVYQQLPSAVAIPRTEADIRRLILFAREQGTSLVPRTAGTSLSGQVVGEGIIVDVSRHFTEIVEINVEERWVRVQPGVIRNELNLALAKHGLLFGPETSTQNRAMIGGMVGNNSCGSNSIVYGSTRDHVLELQGFLADGTKATFRDLTPNEFTEKCDASDTSLEAQIYRETHALLADPEVRAEIEREFPKPEIPRRNTGYAVDLLMDAAPLSDSCEQPFNFCKLLAGSEGTLFFTTEIKLRCLPLPPACSGVQCAHFESIDEALRATQVAVKHRPFACELIDEFILQGASRNIEQRENMTFVSGRPKAILITALRAENEAKLAEAAENLEADLRAASLGFDYPVLVGKEEEKVWNLRKAGLGILNTIPGDEKPLAVIEDTAVAVADLPDYIREFGQKLKDDYGLECVHYAHAGSGEIHLRPILNLKTDQGNELFRQVATDIARLVKKYRGSLSGEHGDGRLRGEFIRSMIGEQNYEVLERVKQIWDPHNIFNPNKIVDAPRMNSGLRFRPGQSTPDYNTVLDFSESQGVLRAAEMCSGSGDCRKTHLAGGTMCPSYMATRDEQDSTRARANMLRHVLTNPADPDRPFDSEELKQVMDLCLSCKGCKRECPSNVDVAKLKAEFLQGYYDVNGVPRRARLIADFARTCELASRVPWLYNFAVEFAPLAALIKRVAGFAQERPLPKLQPMTLRAWLKRRKPPAMAGKRGRVFLFCDEFTNYTDAHVGIAAVELLEQLGYAVEVPEHAESGRGAISKGLLRRARDFAEENVRTLKGLVTEKTPLVGIEPSAILSFRDEYPALVSSSLRKDAIELGKHCLLLDEFLAREVAAGRISSSQFTEERKEIRLHGHCHQKAIASLAPTVQILSVPKNYVVKPVSDDGGFDKTGCCGMAGSFGYEREHYQLSKQIAELVLLPAVRKLPGDVLIAAPGTSCRNQIADLADRPALHPVQILRQALD